MSLILPPDDRLLRLMALTPANCGDAFGTATVDRPVSVDAWRELPYLPSSSLKGVLAGRRGNVFTAKGSLNRRRTDLYGAPDREDRGDGEPSKVVFGDGEPLAFPLLMTDGQRAWVVVAETVFQLARWGFVPAQGLRPVESDLAFEGEVPRRILPPLSQTLERGRFGLERGVLTWLTGAANAPFLVAAPKAARALWLTALEDRTQTALGEDRRVKAGSLRTVELIPAGSVFVSVVSNLHGQPIELGEASPLQLGAWESCGLGYFRGELVDARSTPPEQNTGPAEHSRKERASGVGERLPNHEVMRGVFEAVEVLAKRIEAGRVRSAIFDLGPRLGQQGVPATLAFCLAKAGGGEAEPSSGVTSRNRDQLAYRWILSQLFQMPKGASYDALHRRVVTAITEGDLPPDFEPTRLWLRRYAEILLPKGADHE